MTSHLMLLISETKVPTTWNNGLIKHHKMNLQVKFAIDLNIFFVMNIHVLGAVAFYNTLIFCLILSCLLLLCFEKKSSLALI